MAVGWPRCRSFPAFWHTGRLEPRLSTGAKALALRVIADRLDHGEPVPELERVFAVVA